MRVLTFCTVLWAISFPVMKALALAQQQLVPGADSWFLTSLGVMYRFGLAGLVLLGFNARQIAGLSRLELEQGLVLATAMRSVRVTAVMRWISSRQIQWRRQ